MLDAYAVLTGRQVSEPAPAVDIYNRPASGKSYADREKEFQRLVSPLKAFKNCLKLLKRHA